MGTLGTLFYRIKRPVHVIAWIQDHHYNPGLVASLVLNIPLGTAAIVILTDAGVGNTAAWAV